MTTTNLPSPDIQDSAEATKLFFSQYGDPILEFSSEDVATSISFFQSKGFSRDAALSTTSILLKQAKVEEVPVFRIIDTLGKADPLQLSAIVAEILNNNRKSISSLGYRLINVTKEEALRNIAP